jgi:hypothetical protein
VYKIRLCNLLTVVKQITHSDVDATDRLFTVVLLYNIHKYHELQHFKVVVNITCTDRCTQPRRPSAGVIDQNLWVQSSDNIPTAIFLAIIKRKLKSAIIGCSFFCLPVCCPKNITIQIYRTVIIPVVLYGCEARSLKLRNVGRGRSRIGCRGRYFYRIRM